MIEELHGDAHAVIEELQAAIVQEIRVPSRSPDPKSAGTF